MQVAVACRGGVVYFEHCHIAYEVYASHLYVQYVYAQAFGEVGFHFVVFVGCDEVDAVVLHQFECRLFQSALANPDDEEDERVGEQQLHEGYVVGNGVDNRQGDDDEHVCHLSDGHCIGAVSHY